MNQERPKIKTAVTFKAKPFRVQTSDGRVETYVRFKKPENIQKSDCDLGPTQHPFYNSDVFVDVLRRAYRKTLMGWEKKSLENLPEGVQVSADGFLREVSVECWV